jgi:methyl coenzyme M reductase beta subunit
MKKFAVPALAALMVLSAGTAFAWSDVTGMIKTINPKSHEIVLDNGKTYVLDQGVAIGTFKTGDKVTMTTQVENGKNMVNKLAKAT